MLVLSRKVGQKLLIGDDVVVTVHKINGNRAVLMESILREADGKLLFTPPGRAGTARDPRPRSPRIRHARLLICARVHVHHPGPLSLEAHRTDANIERERSDGVREVEQQRHARTAEKKKRITPSRTAVAARRDRVLPVAATRVYRFARASMCTIPDHFPLKHTA